MDRINLNSVELNFKHFATLFNYGDAFRVYLAIPTQIGVGLTDMLVQLKRWGLHVADEEVFLGLMQAGKHPTFTHMDIYDYAKGTEFCVVLEQ